MEQGAGRMVEGEGGGGHSVERGNVTDPAGGVA